jgi:sugar phosphate isomerase/epimerase
MNPLRLGIEAGSHTVAMAQELGVRGVPVDIHDLVKKGGAALRAELAAQGVEPCQVGAFGYNPLHPDLEYRQQQAELILSVLPELSALGCAYVVINGGNRHPSGFGHGDLYNFSKEGLHETAENLKPLCEAAAANGGYISIEPYIKSCASSAERFCELADAVGSSALRMNLDVTNHYDLGAMWDPRDLIRTTARTLGARTGLVHLKEVVLKEGFHIHMDLGPIGDGPTDWGLVLQEAAPFVAADSWVLVEHIGSPEEARRSFEIVRAAGAAVGVALA